MKHILAFLVLLSFSISGFAQSYTLMTIKQKEKENVENFFIEVSKELFKRADLGLRVKSSHWIQAQKKVVSALPDKKMLITPITRTPEREKDYDWLLPLESYTLQFVTNDPDLDISKLDALVELPICVFRESPAEFQLRGLGFTNIKAQVQQKKCFKLLESKKVQVVLAHGQLAAIKRYKQAGGKVDDLTFGAAFEEKTLYLASSKQAVAPSHKKKLEKALEDMKFDGTYEKMRDKY